MRNFFTFLGSILIIGGIGIYFINKELPKWKENVYLVIESLEKEIDITQKFETNNWDKINVKLNNLPSFYPFSQLKSSVAEIPKIFLAIEDLRIMNLDLGESSISTESLLEIFESVEKIDTSLGRIEKKVTGIWDVLLSEEQISLRDEKIGQLQLARQKLKEIKNFENIFKKFSKNKQRIMIVLQNENEPRSSGGFMGSFIIVDFEEEKIAWDFHDIYSFDRQVPERVQAPAPEFFHGLSKTISLRDANIYPNFPTTAVKIRELMAYADEKIPDTIVTINTNIIRELLKLTGPVKLDRWGVVLDEYNFDLVLQFLVESKVAGRYDVKSPVMVFAQELFYSLQNVARKDISALKKIDVKGFIEGKNILAHSENNQLQKLFAEWKLDGKVAMKNEAHNFLQFDFISIGANKSEKFMWTKFTHNSEINANGTVKNTLKIVRNHALKNDEIQKLLDTNLWTENIKELLNEDLLWKLGAGQNRTILRITVPNSARLLTQANPSGDILQKESEDGDFQVFEIPMYVVPGEKLNINLEYETIIEEGSHNWRPYYLQMVGTPARQKTSFLGTISTKDGGKFSAETYNIGRPVNLIDQDFRAVITF